MRRMTFAFYLVLISTAVMLLLSGCAQLEKQPDGVPYSVSGMFDSYNQTENGLNIVMWTDTGMTIIEYSVEIPGIEGMQYGYEITSSGLSYTYEDGTVRYVGDFISVDKIPLELQLGYNGFDLMKQDYTYTYTSLLAQAELSYTSYENGRSSDKLIKMSHYIDQDENARYTSILKEETVDGVTSSTSSLEYVDKKEGSAHILVNYGKWSLTQAVNTGTITFAMDEDSITISEFYEEGSNICVEGKCVKIPKSSYLWYVVQQLDNYVPFDVEDTNLSFIAKFNKDSKLLIYIEFNYHDDPTVSSGDASVSVSNLVITLSGINFNNEGVVQIPDYVKNPDLQEVPLEEEEYEDPTLPLCESLLDMSVEDLTDENIDLLLGGLEGNENAPGDLVPAEVIYTARAILTDKTMDEFLGMFESEELTPEEQYVIEVLSTYLVEALDDGDAGEM